jgi:hypothetical protein
MFMDGRVAESAAEAPVPGTVARLYTGMDSAAYGGGEGSSSAAEAAAAVAAAATTLEPTPTRGCDDVVKLNLLVADVSADPATLFPLLRPLPLAPRGATRGCSARTADDTASDDIGYPVIHSCAAFVCATDTRAPSAGTEEELVFWQFKKSRHHPFLGKAVCNGQYEFHSYARMAALLWWGNRPLADKAKLAEDEEKKAARQARAALLRWSKSRSELDVGMTTTKVRGGDSKMARLTDALLAAKPKLDAAGRLIPPAAGAAGASGDGTRGKGKSPTGKPPPPPKEEMVAPKKSLGMGRWSKAVEAVKVQLSKGEQESAGIEWCAKRRAEKRRERRREVRGIRAVDETFAPAPQVEMPRWYARRNARVRWERLARGALDATRRRVAAAVAASNEESVPCEEDLWRSFADALVRAASWAHGDAAFTLAHARSAADRATRSGGGGGGGTGGGGRDGGGGGGSKRAVHGQTPGPVFSSATRPNPGTAASGAPGYHTERIAAGRGEGKLLPRFPGGYDEER